MPNSRKSHKKNPIKSSKYTVEVDSDGNTKLHKLAQAYSPRSPESRNGLLKFVKENEAASLLMSRMVNNNGELPADCINFLPGLLNSRHAETIQDMREFLIDLSDPQDFKPISSPISFEQTKIQYDLRSGTTLHDNAQLACKVANKIRGKIKESDTHPDSYHTSYSRIYYSEEVYKMRSAISYSWSESWDSWWNNNQITVMKKTASAAIHAEIGNCYEFMAAAYCFAREENKTVPLNQLTVTNGDHFVLEIGEGSDKVICDAWAGKVFPYSELSKELNCFRNFSHQKSTVTFFNSNYHKVQTIPIEPQEKASHSSGLKKMGLFGVSALAAITTAYVVTQSFADESTCKL